MKQKLKEAVNEELKETVKWQMSKMRMTIKK